MNAEREASILTPLDVDVRTLCAPVESLEDCHLTRMRNLFDEIREGLEAYRDHPDTLRRRELFIPNVRTIREQFGLSQSQMATFLSVSKRTLENWEQGRRSPTGPARTLLRVMEREPHAVKRALG